MKIILFLIYFVSNLNMYVFGKEKDCVPASVEVAFHSQHKLFSKGGNYIRTNSEGTLLMGTTTASDPEVILYRIEGYPDNLVLTEFKTPMKSESYPVEPNWDYIVSPYHGEYSHFYKTSDLLQLQEKSIPVLKDKFTEYYHSVGGSEDKFRVVNWSFLSSKKYTQKDNSISPASGFEIICHNLLDLPDEYKGIGEWMVEAMPKLMAMFQDPAVEKEFTKVEEKYADAPDMVFLAVAKKHLGNFGLTNDDLDMFVKVRKLKESGLENRYSLLNPIISTDGKEIAGIREGTTKIYKINPDNTCSLKEDLGTRTGKVSFGYPDKKTGKIRFVAFNAVIVNEGNSTSRMQPMVMDREKGVTVAISNQNAGYVNVTEDNRAILFENRKLKILDLFQTTDGEIGDHCVFREKQSSEKDSSETKAVR